MLWDIRLIQRKIFILSFKLRLLIKLVLAKVTCFELLRNSKLRKLDISLTLIWLDTWTLLLSMLCLRICCRLENLNCERIILYLYILLPSNIDLNDTNNFEECNCLWIIVDLMSKLIYECWILSWRFYKIEVVTNVLLKLEKVCVRCIFR